MPTRLHYFIHALRARSFYKRQGYRGNALPCLACTWEYEPEDTETPWQWIFCDRCDWGNQ